MFEVLAALFLLPWWGLGALALLILLDVALLHGEEVGFGTALLLVGTFALFEVGADVNILMAAWNNLGSTVSFFLTYFLIGGGWSVAKWYLYLLNVREKLREDWNTWKSRSGPTITEPKRPYESYAKNNKGRIFGWIGHWPASMIQTFVGDFIFRLVRNIYSVLSGVYDKIANNLFAEFEVKK